MATTSGLKELIIGILIVSIIATSIIITMGNEARIQVDKDKSSFFVFDGSNWVTSGVEYNQIIYQGRPLNRGTTTISEINTSDKVIITRFAPYGKTNVTDTYLFHSAATKENFPISHSVQVVSGKGRIYVYQVKNLIYSGPTMEVWGNSMSFGRNMKVEWDHGYSSATINAEGTLEIKYPIKTDNQTFQVRLFDPLGDFLASYSPLGCNGTNYTAYAFVNDQDPQVVSTDDTPVDVGGNYTLILAEMEPGSFATVWFNASVPMSTCDDVISMIGATSCCYVMPNEFIYNGSGNNYYLAGMPGDPVTFLDGITYPPALTWNGTLDDPCTAPSGDWTINSSINCANKDLVVNGSIYFADDSITAEVSTSNFSTNQGAVYDLRNNSAAIDFTPDLDPSTPSTYTDNWNGGSSTHIFNIAMNESMNQLSIFTNNTDNSDWVYSISIDGPQQSGGIMGKGEDLLFGYVGDFGGPLVVCYNSTIDEGISVPCGGGPVTCGNISGYDETYFGNFTVNCVQSGNAIELVIGANTAGWIDKETHATDFVQFEYTTFKNSSSLTPGIDALGNLTLNNVSLDISGFVNFTLGYLTINNSEITFLLSSNGSAGFAAGTGFSDDAFTDLIIDHSVFTVNDSSLHGIFWLNPGQQAFTSNYSITNSNISYVGVGNGDMIGSPFEGGVVISSAIGGIFNNNVITNCGSQDSGCLQIYANNSGMTIRNNTIIAAPGFNAGGFSSPGGGPENIDFSNNFVQGSGLFSIGARNSLFDSNYFNGSIVLTTGERGNYFANNQFFKTFGYNVIEDMENNYYDTMIYSSYGIGMITWNKTSFQIGSPDMVGLQNKMVISDNLIGIYDDIGLSVLNSSAQIDMYNLVWDSNVELCTNVGGSLINCVPCNASYNCSYSAGNLTANVSHFSNYSSNGDGPAGVTYLSNFTDTFTGVTINTSRYLLDEGGNLSMAQNGTLVINGTDDGFESWEGIYTNLSVNTSDSFYVSVDVNITNTSAITPPGYADIWLSFYDVGVDSDFTACQIYIDPSGTYLRDGNGGLPISISATNGTLVMSFNMSSMNYTCQFAGESLTNENISGPTGNYSLSLSSDAYYTSVWAEMDNLEFAYGVYSVPAAPTVNYLSNFNDTFDNSTINESFYSILPYGMTTSQNNRIIVNGSQDQAGGLATIDYVNASSSFEIYVDVTMTNSSAITGDNAIISAIFVSDFATDFARCKVQKNSSGQYLVFGDTGMNITSVSTTSGELHMTYNTSNNVVTCSFDGQSISYINESGPTAANFSLSILGATDGSNKTAIPAWNTTFDDLRFSYGITGGGNLPPSVALLSPPNGSTYANDTVINFSCSAISTVGLANMTQSVSSGFNIWNTSTVIPGSLSYIYNVSLGPGYGFNPSNVSQDWNWTCSATDSLGQTTTASPIWQFHYGSTPSNATNASYSLVITQGSSLTLTDGSSLTITG
jgi:hypothetical protein